MAINYISGTEDVPVLFGNYDEGDHWWGGVQQCFVSVALAAVLAATALTQQAQAVANAHQDDPVGNLTATVDEYFWQNPTPPVPASLYQNLPYLPDPEEIPVAALYSPPDEVFWANPTAPVPGSLLAPQQWTFDEQTPILRAQFDEDFWPAQLLPAPVSEILGPLYLPDPEEIPAGSLSRPVVDEDFWQNPAPPVPLTFWQPLPYFFDEAATTTQLVFVPDEDFLLYQVIWPDDSAISLW